MHTLGKVFTWLMLPLTLAAVYFTAQVINVRNSWTAASDQLRMENQSAQERVAQKKFELDQLRSQYSLLMRPWERLLDNKEVGVANAADGSIGAKIGSNTDRMLQPQTNPLPVLHGFALNGPNASTYIGPFRLTDVRLDNSDLRLEWPVIDEQTADWRGGQWRFWQAIPQEHDNYLRSLISELNRSIERLGKAKSTLAQADEQKRQAQAQIDTRVKEIEAGLADPARNQLPPEDLLGLVQANGDAEALRNQTLREVQTLRGQIYDARQMQSKLVEEINRLSGKLPQPATETAVK